MDGSVRLAFPASAIHVRTARLVAVTVARRSGWPEDTVESVRHAVGEACAMALTRPDDGVPITVEVEESPSGLSIRVWPMPASAPDASSALLRALLDGLTDGAVFEDRDGVMVLGLTWTP